MDRPERELLARYRAGDIDAMGELVELFRRPLFGFILRMTSGHGDADEIFQEVWLRVIKNQSKYTDRISRSDEYRASWTGQFECAAGSLSTAVTEQSPGVSIQVPLSCNCSARSGCTGFNGDC